MIEIIVQPNELEFINSIKKDCLLTLKERITLITTNNAMVTFYSLSEKFCFCHVYDEGLGYYRFIVLQKQNSNTFTEVKQWDELNGLSVMHFEVGTVEIKDVHWGADVFLHITAYNIVHDEYYMVNCRVGFDRIRHHAPSSIDADWDWDGLWGHTENVKHERSSNWIGDVEGFCMEVKRIFGDKLDGIQREVDYVQTESGTMPIYLIWIKKSEWESIDISLENIMKDLREKYNVVVGDICCTTDSSDGQDHLIIPIQHDNVESEW